MARIIQFSDTHLRSDHWRHQRAFSRAVRRGGSADLALITGDLSVDGADRDADLIDAKARFDRLRYSWRALPGNHDIGEEPASPRKGQPVNTARLARYTKILGDGWFAEDLPGWRLIGLNAQLFGTGLPEETHQWSHFEQYLASKGQRRVGVFLHKPLFIQAPDEVEIAKWAVAQTARERLLSCARGGDAIAFFSSGHLHQSLIREEGGVRHIWCPATANSAQTLLASGAMPGTGMTISDLEPTGRYRVRFEFS
ncbi:MAG: metallophosphoesterase [Pseudomonadota bacterium]